MITNQPPLHIKQLQVSRPDIFAFEITGHLENSDLENLYGLLEGAHEISDPIHTVFIFHDYEGVSWGDVVNGEVFLDKADALRHIGKCAVVGAPGWVQAGMALLRPFMHAQVQLFSLEKEQDAWAWIMAAIPPPPDRPEDEE